MDTRTIEATTMTVDAMRRKLLERKIGDFSEISPDELFKMAVQSEKTAKDLGPLDIAWTHFMRAMDAYIEAAAIREREEAGRE